MSRYVKFYCPVLAWPRDELLLTGVFVPEWWLLLSISDTLDCFCYSVFGLLWLSMDWNIMWSFLPTLVDAGNALGD